MIKELYYYEHKVDGVDAVQWGLDTEIHKDYFNVRIATYNDLIDWSTACEAIIGTVKVKEGLYMWCEESFFDEDLEEWSKEVGYQLID